MGEERQKVAIVGGGAAGFFTAANLDGNKFDILLFERAKNVLQKVKIAGGGRCNVTHACFDPKELVHYYPRGHKELRSVFTKFQPGDTMAWFEAHGLALKTEKDNRMFPVTDSSQDVINVLKDATKANGAEVKTKEGVMHLERHNAQWMVTTKQNTYKADHIVFCTGSSPKAYTLLDKLGLKLVPLVPSLFTFNIKDAVLEGLMGTSFPEAAVKIPDLNVEDAGPLLVTHWGLSGPAVLKLSAWCARALADKNYLFTIGVNFIGLTQEMALTQFKNYKAEHAKQSVGKAKPFAVTRRFWQQLLQINGVEADKQLANVSQKAMSQLVKSLCASRFKVTGKSTFKEEFVTAGGVDLPQIDFKTMRVRQLPNFYMAGEVLNIDAVTGGFNFQACWSEAWLIAQDLNNMSNIKVKKTA